MDLRESSGYIRAAESKKAAIIYTASYGKIKRMA
jgi:hypothetical protein